MAENQYELLEKKQGKKFYNYQQKALDQIFVKINENPTHYNLLYQLPTGGGKTVIFSGIARRYIQEVSKKVLILTHRIELCGQTSNMLDEFGVPNKIIDSKVKKLPTDDPHLCYVAMVETLNNRLQEGVMDFKDVGLVIVDEAHYNSFRKLFKYFEEQVILGVTATPLSSNAKLPMYEVYKELIVGDSIRSLIKQGFLAKGITYTYDVNLTSLKVGTNGDYTVASSEKLYSSIIMQEKLLQAYEEKALGKKTLIFNNGINTSKYVLGLFREAGYDIRHLDNTSNSKERKETLKWFKEKPDAILTSVGLLTTGFDEPTVESIILNRATRSLTLYHQMIGRGSRILPGKDEFQIIDLGNNAARFGLWDSPLDWQHIFQSPEDYYDNLVSDEEIQRHFQYEMPDSLRSKFANTEDVTFDIKGEYKRAIAEGKKPRIVIEKAISHHAKMCIENSDDLFDAKALARELKEDINYKVRLYSYCICKTTNNYLKWLEEDYTRRLNGKISEEYAAVM
ncbi:DEAD/DEAH box helicase [Luteibaculum oceani]|uniref:DEAD/DEAH box helicase n=1 Tax=Luteibaculum oceani TaxID=1294296 RepID=A0A5C6V8H3_9FLAO|nr:DEAD/DEAH box helicase family protein [Luteibaculum oceani]TXC81673.1 DEAD/DEAH box helicase [Luteibaculum oceani]